MPEARPTHDQFFRELREGTAEHIEVSDISHPATPGGARRMQIFAMMERWPSWSCVMEVVVLEYSIENINNPVVIRNTRRRTS